MIATTENFPGTPRAPLKPAWRFLIAVLLGLACVPLACLVVFFAVMMLLQGFYPNFDYLCEDALLLYTIAALLLAFSHCLRKIGTLLRKPDKAAPVRPRRIPWLVKTSIVALLAMPAIFFIDGSPVGLFGSVWMFRCYPWLFHRSHMERIVEEVRKQDFHGRESFMLDYAGNLKPWDRMTSPPVWASRDDDGTLSVEIVLLNYGHAGHYGYLYSDKPMKTDPMPDDEEDGRLRFLAPGPMEASYPNYKIDDHWWKVWDDMD